MLVCNVTINVFFVLTNQLKTKLAKFQIFKNTYDRIIQTHNMHIKYIKLLAAKL